MSSPSSPDVNRASCSWLVGWWAVGKTAQPWEYGGRSGSISHAIRCDFPCICGRNHTQDSQVEASDEILGTHRITRGTHAFRFTTKALTARYIQRM
jgi:hypothetical protein